MSQGGCAMSLKRIHCPQSKLILPCTSLLVLLGLSGLSSQLSAQQTAHDTLQEQIQTYSAVAATANPPGVNSVAAGRIWAHLGTLYENAGMYSQSESSYLHALHLLELPPVSEVDRARALDDLGTLYMVKGDTEQADRAEQKALKLREAAGLRADLPRSWYHLATLSLREHRAVTALDYAAKAVSQLNSANNVNPDDQINAQFVMGAALCRLHRYSEAIAAMKSAMDAVHEAYGLDDFPTGFGSFLLGYAYWKSGDLDHAEELMRFGSEQVKRQLGWEHPACILVMNQYQRFLRNTHRLDEARSLEEQLKKIREAPIFGQSRETLVLASLF